MQQLMTSAVLSLLMLVLCVLRSNAGRIFLGLFFLVMAIPIVFPASTIRLVTSRSLRLGSEMPEGLLWARMSPAALAQTAGLNTSRGCTKELVRVPMETVWISITAFFAPSSRMTKRS